MRRPWPIGGSCAKKKKEERKKKERKHTLIHYSKRRLAVYEGK